MKEYTYLYKTATELKMFSNKLSLILAIRFICMVHDTFTFSLFLFLQPLKDKNLKTMLALVQKSDPVYDKFLEVVSKYEDAALSGQTQCISKDKKKSKLKAMPVYQFRPLSCLTDDNALQVLNMLLKGELHVSQIFTEIRRAQIVQYTQRALCRELKAKSWDELQSKYPRHMKREVLSNQFGHVS